MRALVLAALLLAVVYITESWHWRECRKVGHGVLYCLASHD